MVGDIAEHFLTAKAHRQVRALLERDRLADRALSHRTTLGEVASWADEIKDYPWGRKLASWHFDDVPLCEAPDYARYCRNGRCASAQIAAHLVVLGDPRATPRRRNEALKWIVHLVGDIHQPLHASTRRDRGGNLVLVSYFGKTDNPPYGPMNLHAVWDIFLLQRLSPAPIGPAERASLERGSVADWVAESHALARDVVYPALPGHSSCARAPGEALEIGDAYARKATPVIELQIRRAGVRLAKLLNDAFDH